MLALEIVDIARATATHLEERNQLAGAVIAMNKTTGREMAKDLASELQAGDEGAEPDSIAGVPVVYKDDVEDPVLITAAGKVYSLLPDWAKVSKTAHAEISRILKPVH